jgi:acetoacetyl-CoA synthetase
MTLLRRLRGELGRSVSLDAFVADPSISGLRAALAAKSTPAPEVELLRAGSTGVPPLVLVHGPYGDVDLYRSMVDALVTDAPVYGITAHPGTENGVGTLSIADLARRHVTSLSAVLPTGPVRLAGYSFGGLVAYETARLLTDRGREVTFLGLLDVGPPAASVSPSSRRLRTLAWYVSLLVPGVGDETLGHALRRKLSRRGRQAQPDRHARTLAAVTRVYDAHRWGPYSGPVTFFQVRRRIPVIEHRLWTWRRIAPDLTVVSVPGAHDDLLAARHARELAARVSRALAATDRTGTT